MVNTRSIVPLLAALAGRGLAYTWPDLHHDYLEALLYQQQQYHGSLVGSDVKYCFLSVFDLDELRAISGRQAAAEWIRVAYHDMSTADVEAGTGGLDASISFETDRAENKGPAFNATMRQLNLYISAKSSMADLIAMSVHLAAAGCSEGKLDIPFRGGRIDAHEAGRLGVPEPQQSLDEHTEIFRKQGFNQTEMIGLVACGHSVGGVHGDVFPEIVPDLNDPRNEASQQAFDDSPIVFDNHVAKGFTENASQNALAYGHNEETRSDHRIFTADGGNLISRMAADNDFYLETCRDLLERMINTVPRDVQLTEVIKPLHTKPDFIDVKLNDDGSFFISGEIRTIQGADIDREKRQVTVHLQHGDETTAFSTEWRGESLPFHENRPSFDWWGFNGTISAAQGLKFEVEIADDGGDARTEDNGGVGFPIQTVILPQVDRSCATIENEGNKVNVVVAILDEANFDTVELSVSFPQAQQGSWVPRIAVTPVTMEKTGAVEGGYSLYEGSLEFGGGNLAGVRSYDVIGRRGAESGDEVVMNEFNMFYGMKDC